MEEKIIEAIFWFKVGKKENKIVEHAAVRGRLRGGLGR